MLAEVRRGGALFLGICFSPDLVHLYDLRYARSPLGLCCQAGIGAEVSR